MSGENGVLLHRRPRARTACPGRSCLGGPLRQRGSRRRLRTRGFSLQPVSRSVQPAWRHCAYISSHHLGDGLLGLPRISISWLMRRLGSCCCSRSEYRSEGCARPAGRSASYIRVGCGLEDQGSQEALEIRLDATSSWSSYTAFTGPTSDGEGIRLIADQQGETALFTRRSTSMERSSSRAPVARADCTSASDSSSPSGTCLEARRLPAASISSKGIDLRLHGLRRLPCSIWARRQP